MNLGKMGMIGKRFIRYECRVRVLGEVSDINSIIAFTSDGRGHNNTVG